MMESAHMSPNPGSRPAVDSGWCSCPSVARCLNDFRVADAYDLSIPIPACYIVAMTSKVSTKGKRRRTTMMPVTTMEEVPVPSPKEREQLLQALRQAETRIRGGEGVDHDPKTFKRRLVRIYRDSRI
jgi:hypothetical protein